MLLVKKQELEIDKELKKKIDIICSFCNTKPTYIKGSIRKIDKTNIAYVEPHRIIIRKLVFLAFNNHNQIYLNNLNNVVPLNQLETILKKKAY